jgi:hypothetical protein
MPQTLEQLNAAPRDKPGPKTHKRQVTTEDGTKCDMRSDYVRMIVDAKAKDLENVAYSLLYQLRTSNVKVVQRRMRGELHDMILDV